MEHLFSKLSVRQKVTVALSLSFILLLSVGIVSYITTIQLIDSSNAVSEKIWKIQLRSQLLDELVNAETSQRGYIITGEGDYLVPYAESINTYPAKMQALLKLAGNPEEASRLHHIDTLAQLKLEELATTINIRVSKGFASSAEIIKGNTGKDYLDQIKSINRELDIIDQNDLVALSKVDSAAVGRSLFAIFLGSVLELAVVVLAIIFINRDLKKGEKVI